MGKGTSFRKAFENLTQIKLDSFHSFFDSDIKSLKEIDDLFNNRKYEKVKNQILFIFEEKGFYFNEAPLLLQYLVDIYVKEKDYKEAERYLVKYTEYVDTPSIYEKLSNISLFYDKKLAIKYAEKAVKSAERKDWNVEIYKDQLNELLK